MTFDRSYAMNLIQQLEQEEISRLTQDKPIPNSPPAIR